MKRNESKSPAPFFFLPLQGEVSREKPPVHDRFRGYSGRIELSLVVDSRYLFVGSGAFEFGTEKGIGTPDVWLAFCRSNGRLCIPGTSLKGAVRSIVEAISASCVRQVRREETLPRMYEPCRDPGNLCPACRIFGTTGFRGRVCFADAFPRGNVTTEVVKIGELWGPRRSEGRKFYRNGEAAVFSDRKPEKNRRFLEVVPEKTRFETTLFFENLEEGELGLLGYAMGWEKKREEERLVLAFRPKIGGAKPRCFGTVQFVPKKVVLFEFHQKALWESRVLEGQDMHGFLVRCLEASKRNGLVREDALRFLRSMLKDREYSCPQDVY
jgi:CRISPR/Cas system CSM-associated protein Csm3 (group 7 of RAMP superfamily)